MSRRPGPGRTRLAHLPTPLVEAPRLAAALGRSDLKLWVKLDNLTGFALGGNKVRKLEYELAPEALEGVTHLVTTGGTQSNHARVTAAAAARLGLGCVLVLNGAPERPPTGNALLHRLYGADVRHVHTRDERGPAAEATAREIREAGGRALVVPLGASTGRGALGYVRAAAELDRQLPPGPVEVFVACSSCGTLAGLLAGFGRTRGSDARVTAVSSDTSEAEIRRESDRLCDDACRLAGHPPGSPPRLRIDVDQIGPGYGIPTEASEEALRLFARSEGIVLDPVYTAKAAAGLVHAARTDRVASGSTVVFLHTGGEPALFA